MSSQEKEPKGLTLNVYMYVAKNRKPLGPRDVTRGLNLSSPSVAYRHLQNLEASGLLKRNEYGEYTLNEKAKINGFHWVGRALLPRTMLYSFVFLALLVAEIIVLALHWQWETYDIKVYYALGMTITGSAMAFFLLEAFLTLRRIKAKETA